MILSLDLFNPNDKKDSVIPELKTRQADLFLFHTRDYIDIEIQRDRERAWNKEYPKSLICDKEKRSPWLVVAHTHPFEVDAHVRNIPMSGDVTQRLKSSNSTCQRWKI